MNSMLNNASNNKQNASELNDLFSSPPNPFYGEVPQTDYLMDKVFQRITLDELPKTMPFDVPSNYWEKPVVIPKNKQHVQRAIWFPYFQAASILLVIGLNVLPFLNTNHYTSAPLSSNRYIATEEEIWVLENEQFSADWLWFDWDEILQDDHVDLTAQYNTESLGDLTHDDVLNFF